jgi:hypothetical protein
MAPHRPHRPHQTRHPQARKIMTSCREFRIRLSGLWVQPFQKLLAVMMISGSGPTLTIELCARSDQLVFPIRICSIVAPIQVIVFSHPLGTVASDST